jgi:enoyl-[acyl-carrier-protein] reductase (NADH)
MSSNERSATARPLHFLALDGARLITGEMLYIDGCYHIMDWPCQVAHPRQAADQALELIGG